MEQPANLDIIFVSSWLEDKAKNVKGSENAIQPSTYRCMRKHMRETRVHTACLATEQTWNVACAVATILFLARI